MLLRERQDGTDSVHSRANGNHADRGRYLQGLGRDKEAARGKKAWYVWYLGFPSVVVGVVCRLPGAASLIRLYDHAIHPISPPMSRLCYSLGGLLISTKLSPTDVGGCPTPSSVILTDPWRIEGQSVARDEPESADTGAFHWRAAWMRCCAQNQHHFACNLVFFEGVILRS